MKHVASIAAITLLLTSFLWWVGVTYKPAPAARVIIQVADYAPVCSIHDDIDMACIARMVMDDIDKACPGACEVQVTLLDGRTVLAYFP